jgi:hypothetical protein
MLERDVTALNECVSGFFDVLSSLLELLALVPVLYILSPWLTVLVAVSTPGFVFMQLRQKDFIINASATLRKEETRYMVALEENLVFGKYPHTIA